MSQFSVKILNAEVTFFQVDITAEVFKSQRMHLHCPFELGETQVCGAETVVKMQRCATMQFQSFDLFVTVILRNESFALVGEQIVEVKMVGDEIEFHFGIAVHFFIEP